ncbi:MAG: hypothetical protein K9M49_09590 [Candidatus Marinimicrobia bacterium]|nr:hypothetical protein [Candidatus Neomarinimicrobiota bacterium]MCF7851080.1 hypothetical protein [Candidatus Neomarinimicrobiota bacterium]MCF7905385.1 hypothetical protein [Candidatus Neomarinimicrobiota bacterium]
MKKTQATSRTRRLVSLLLLAVFLLPSSVNYAAEARWIKVGSLHNFYQAIGSEPEEDYGDEQQFGMRWNAFYDHQDMQAAKGMWIAVRNYDDPLAGTVFPYKIAHCGPRPRPEIATSEFMPTDFGMVGKYAAPTVIVDGELASDLDFDDLVDAGGFDPNLKADRMIHNQVNTSTGISFDRKVHGFSHQYYDNFFIYEYTFVNTGVYDRAGNAHNQTLDGVYFHWQYRNSVAGEGTVEGSGIDFRGRRGWGTPQNCRWGMNTMNDVIGEDPNNPKTTSDFASEFGKMGIDEQDNDGEYMRAFYSWHGRHSTLSYDNIGSPNVLGWLADGMLGASQFTGCVVLHADKSPSDHSDDPMQPTTTRKIESNDPETTSNDQFSSSRMERGYTQFVAAGHEAQSHAEQVGSGFPDQFSVAGGYSQTWSFGPYNMAPGDTVRIVIAEAAAGISRKQNLEIGNTWYKDEILGDTQTLVMPDGSTTTNADDFKNAWVYTSRDSLIETFRRARDLYLNKNMDLSAMPNPEPPNTFEITSQGNAIKLEWADNVEISHPNFDGYKIYRAKGSYDSTYYEIADLSLSAGNLTENVYYDKTAERGQLYFYYIIAYDDGSTNSLFPGVPLRSSPFFTRANKGASMLKPPAEGVDGITIVPNPYIVRNTQLQYIGEQNSVKFWNLPEKCDINVFTERGDKIYSYDHEGSGVATWDLLTSSRQIIVSGVYIVTFETPDGDKAIRKLVVIR